MFAYAGKIKPGVKTLDMDGNLTTVKNVDFYGGDKGCLPTEGYVRIVTENHEIEADKNDIVYAAEDSRAWVEIESSEIAKGDHIIFANGMGIQYGKVEKVIKVRTLMAIWLSGCEKPMALRIESKAYITTALHLRRHVDLFVE